MLFIYLCVELLNCTFELFKILCMKHSCWHAGRKLEPNKPHSCPWVLQRAEMNVGMPDSTLHEQHWLISFSLALGSGCLIKCKHLNDLSYSVDFLSIILTKLFTLLTSWQAFQVIWKCFVKFCTSLDLSRTVIKQWREVKRQFTFYEKCRYPGDKLSSRGSANQWAKKSNTGRNPRLCSQGTFSYFSSCGWYHIP